ncbi:MAG: hypothetical protein HY713_13645 [candidate division NC10 bacterium]|nr:hypothetical protein [candidate division NC10 bacterium]
MWALARPRMGRVEDASHGHGVGPAVRDDRSDRRPDGSGVGVGFMSPRTSEQPPVSRQVMVPLFIRQGELIRIEVATGKYLERVKEAGKK